MYTRIMLKCNRELATKYIGGQGQHPRTVIYTSKSIKAWFIETLSNRDLTAIVVKLNNRETLVISAYLDNEERVIQPWLTTVMEHAKQRGYAVLIGMDSNCHSELYGLETNKRGEHVEDFLGQYNLRVENQGRTPTFQSSNCLFDNRYNTYIQNSGFGTKLESQHQPQLFRPQHY